MLYYFSLILAETIISLVYVSTFSIAQNPAIQIQEIYTTEEIFSLNIFNFYCNSF